MLTSNWSIGDARRFRPHVIRQKIGRASPAKSGKPHKCMGIHARENLCAKLEYLAAKRAQR